VLGDDGVRTGFLDDDGSLRFDRPMRTGTLTVLFADMLPARSFDPYRDSSRELPIGVSELTVLDDAPIGRAAADRKLTLRCGTGPAVSIDGVTRTSALVASRRDLLEMREVQARLCGRGAATPVPVTAGTTRVVSVASSAADPVRLTLTPIAAGQGAGVPEAVTDRETPVRTDSWAPTVRRLHLDAYPNQRVLALRENTNPGWVASMAGESLRPLVVDGWQQGWIVPPGPGGEVVLRFAPDRTYAAAISAGALLLTGVAVAAVLPPRGAGAAAIALPPVRRRRRHWVLPLLIGGGSLLAVGGVTAAGLAALGLAGLIALRTLRPHLDTHDRRRLRQVTTWARFLLPVVLFALAGWFALTVEGPHTAALPQLTALGAGVALWLSVLVAGGRGRR
ncbi:MAG: DUF3367 domain-containing protein, partial [Actinoplanes sp.]